MKAIKRTSLVLSNLLIPLAILIFAKGFFPYKPFISGLATFEEAETEELGLGLLNSNERPDRIFDKVIFMTVDALRSDFVYGHGSGFEFTQSLIRSGAALPFTAHATPPTITMPRVKALTTGSVPSFLDVILNFAESDTSSSLATQDTWLAQAKAHLGQGRLVFYGDDTWLKLFPDFFARHDGTSSFFVSDFTEVDNNVTRHVPHELDQPDWDAMIMHYLGLDHIGHKAGPLSPNMIPKQKEMDGIVQQIYSAIEVNSHLEDTLLILAGDHGMNSGGNHGGSAPGETEPALVFISPKLMDLEKPKYAAPTTPKQGTEFYFYRKVEQNDVVPTIAALLGLPIPRNNLGIIIPEFLNFWKGKTSSKGLDARWQLLYRNILQMLPILKAKFGDGAFPPLSRDEATIAVDCDHLEGLALLRCQWNYVQDAMRSCKSNGLMFKRLNDFLTTAQDTLSTTASSYSVELLGAGTIMSASFLGIAILSKHNIWPPTSAGIVFALISALYGVMMFATSYVEEEQHFWYWATSAWIGYLYLSKTATTGLQKSNVFATFALLALHRISTRWNQTGQKHAGAPDIVHTFFSEHHMILWILIIATYIHIALRIARRALVDIFTAELAAISAISLVLPSFVFKLNFTQADAPELVGGLARSIREWTHDVDLVLQAQTAFFGIGVALIVVFVLVSIGSARDEDTVRKGSGRYSDSNMASRLHTLLTLFLITQTRAQNIPLFLIFDFQAQLLFYLLSVPTTPIYPSSHIYTSPLCVLPTTISTLLLTHTSFFAFGNSNAISSIDLSNAYNGVSGYNVLAVGVLLFLSNWAGPVYWSTIAPVLLTQPSIEEEEARLDRLDARLEAEEGSKIWVQQERAALRKQAAATPTQRAEQQDLRKGVWSEHIATLTIFVLASLTAVMAACTLLRTHLFIWTVFSPKYLYAMAWAAGWHLLVNVIFGTWLWQFEA